MFGLGAMESLEVAKKVGTIITGLATAAIGAYGIKGMFDSNDDNTGTETETEADTTAIEE